MSSKFRRERPELRQRHQLGPGSIQWHGEKAGSPDWSEDSQVVAFSLSGKNGGLYIAFNSSHEAATVQLPHWHARQWRPIIDTGKVRASLHVSSKCRSREPVRQQACPLQSASKAYHCIPPATKSELSCRGWETVTLMEGILEDQ